MLAVAQSMGVERFVHLSTTEVYGNVSGDVDEDWPYRLTGQEYNAAKIEAEKAVWEYGNKGVPVTILRPPIVYGPFGKDFTVRIAHRLESGRWGVFEGAGGGMCNLVYVSDVVAAVLLAIEHEAAVGEAFNINGPEAITWNEYFERFNDTLGLPPLRRLGGHHIQLRAMVMEAARAGAKAILNSCGKFIKVLYKQYGAVRMRAVQFEKTMISTPRLAELQLYARQVRYRDTKARRLLGYRPQVDIGTGLDLSVRWIRHLGVEAFM
jgi:nucleoside-diphosphate-sugar epimerase